jgi:peptide deformylase
MTNSTPHDLIANIPTYQLVYAPHIALDTKVQPFLSGDGEYRQAVSNHMQALCRSHNAHGMAANQIALDAAVFVTHIQQDMVTMFNPEILEISDDKVLMNEGCLSDPGLYLKIKRPDMILASWEDEMGERSQATLVDMDCRIFLHEMDHLQGIMFSDRAGVTKLKMGRTKQRKLMNRAAERIINSMK